MSTDAIAAIPADLVDERDFEGLDWKRVPQLERRQLEQTARGGPRSWVYRHGWPVWHTKFKKYYYTISTTLRRFRMCQILITRREIGDITALVGLLAIIRRLCQCGKIAKTPLLLQLA